jgi:hypothetical protein
MDPTILDNVERLLGWTPPSSAKLFKTFFKIFTVSSARKSNLPNAKDINAC